MLRIPIGENEAVLLTPRWHDLPWPWNIAAPVAIGLAPLVLIVGLYIYELRLLRKSAAAGLLTLRILLAAVLWFVACFQPVAAQFRNEEINGKVFVLVDRSQSMEIRDPPFTPLGKLKLAHALKINIPGDSLPSGMLKRWIDFYQANPKADAPPWIFSNEKLPLNGDRDKIAGMRKSYHDALCRKVDSLTRSQIGEQLLDKTGLKLLDRLTAKHPVEITAFHGTSWAVENSRWRDLFAKRETKPAKKDDKNAVDETFATDLVKPLENILQRSDAGSERVLGVILISDGRHNRGAFREGLAEDFAQVGIPIYPIALGTPTGPPDVELLAVDAPSNVPKNTQVDVKPIIRINAVDHRNLTVELWRTGKTPKLLDKQPLGPNGAVKPFTVPLKEVGDHTMAVKVKGAKKIKELNEHNNEKEFTVRVTDDKIRMLLVDGEARWEYHFLAQALRRDPNVQLDLVLFNQPRIGVVPEVELKKHGHPQKELPKIDEKTQSDSLFQYDCIFLGDVAPEQLPPSDRMRLERYVAERGGSVILMAGKQHLPMKYLNSPKKDDPFVKLFPIARPMDFRPKWGFRLALNEDGKRIPFLRMEAKAADNEERWKKFKPHYFAALGELKPGAISLVDLKLAKPSEDKPPSGAAQQSVLAHHTYGFGRVLYVGLDSTWRWRFRAGDKYHHRFWGQIARWAVKEEFFPAGNRFVRFGSNKPLYNWREKVELKVKFNEQLEILPETANIHAILKRPGADGSPDKIKVKLKRDRFRPQIWHGEVKQLTQGGYEIALEIPERADKLPPKSPWTTPAGGDQFTVLPPTKEEVVQLAPDWQRMDALAANSEGRRLTPENAHELFWMFSQKIERREHKTEQRVWQDPPYVWFLLGLLLTILTAEWIGRKWAGLP